MIQLLNRMIPNQCALCDKFLSEKTVICTDCYANLPWNTQACYQCARPNILTQRCGNCLANPPAFSQTIAPLLYKPPISTSIIHLKFNHSLHYAPMLGQLLLAAIETYYQRHSLPQYIIPVPMHYRRLRQRGFNQAIELARPIAKKLRIPLLLNHYIRQKYTAPQSQLSATARRRNLIDCFSQRRTIQIQRVAIIDDVMTTGETVRTLSQFLKKQGIEKIDIWCCARRGSGLTSYCDRATDSIR